VATAATRFVRGKWHHVQLVFVANTSGLDDGSATLYLNGVRTVHYPIGWCAAGTNNRWEGLNVSPTWGGSGDSAREEMYIEVDHIRMGRAQ
jgi:hypothetical protein